jgi:hypothetical protein
MSIRREAAAVIALSVGSACFAQTGGERCVVNHPHADRGQTVTAKMTVINDGEPCKMHIGFGGTPATSLKIVAKPGNGTLIETKSTVSYTPSPGFAGNDFFDVEWFGVGFGPNSASRNLRTKVEVTVRAKSAESPSVK